MSHEARYVSENAGNKSAQQKNGLLLQDSQPPPWLAHTFQLTSAVPPIFHFSGWYTSRGSGFNAVPFIDLFRYPTKPADDVAETVSMDLMPIAFAAAVITLGVMQILAGRSRAASGARRQDD